MFKMIRAAFNQRRKTLVNALNNSAEIHADKELIQTVLIQAGLLPTVRGEALTLISLRILPTGFVKFLKKI